MPPSVRNSGESGLRIRVAPEDVTLIDWPLMRQPLRSLIAVAAAAGTTWLTAWMTGSPWLAAAVAAALAITLWRTWLPVRYELGGSGIVQSVLGWRRRIPWTAIQSYALDEEGVLLLPDAVSAPLTPLRGLYLRWGERRSEVAAHLEYYLQGWHSARQRE